MTPYLISFLSSLALIAVWHGSIWRKYGRVASIHKTAANALKSFLWAANAILYYNAYPFTWEHVFPAMLAAFVFQSFAWWMLFDVAVNIAGGRAPFHMGQTAATDRIFRDYTTKFFIQLAGVIASGVLLLWVDQMIMR